MEKHSTSQHSPLSPTLWPTEGFRWPDSLLTFAAIVVAALVGVLLAGLLFFWIGHGHPKEAAQVTKQLFPLALAQLVTYAPIIATVVVMLPWLARRDLHDLGLRLPTLREFGVGVAGAILMLFVVTVVSAVQSSFTTTVPHQDVVIDFERSPHNAGFALLASIAVLFAPFTEELVFRGFFFNAFLRYVPFATAALASGAIFGALHIVASGSGPQYALFFPLSAGGIVLAYVYYRTGNLVSSMLSHGLFNSVTVIATLVGATATHVK